MEDISGNLYVKALQSGSVILLVGQNEEQLDIPKAFLSRNSEILSKLVGKADGGVIGMQTESVPVVKMFVRWCYQDHLPPAKTNATLKERQLQKNLLLDFWIFAARYDIVKLQNQAMQVIVSLINTPDLLTKEDIHYIWMHTQGVSDVLRAFAALAVVAQIEEDSGEENQKTIRDFEDLEGLTGLLRQVYTAKDMWMRFDFSKMKKKDKKTKWEFLSQNAEVQKILMVEEKPQAAPTKKRRTFGEPGRGFRGFAPGEIIELD